MSNILGLAGKEISLVIALMKATKTCNQKDLKF